jgi:hypothetical protein
MLLTVLPKEIASSIHTVHEGLALALKSGGGLRNERKLACRHCLPKIPTIPQLVKTDAQGPNVGHGSTQDGPPSQEPQDNQRPTLHSLFTFHGMRSHLRDKSVSSFPECKVIHLHLDMGLLTWETKIFFVRMANLGGPKFL